MPQNAELLQKPEPVIITIDDFLRPPEGEISLRDYVFPAVPTRDTWTPYLVTELAKSGAEKDLLASRLVFLEQCHRFDFRQTFGNFAAATQIVRDGRTSLFVEAEYGLMRKGFDAIAKHKTHFTQRPPDNELVEGILSLYGVAMRDMWYVRRLIRGVTTLKDFQAVFQRQKEELERRRENY